MRCKRREVSIFRSRLERHALRRNPTACDCRPQLPLGKASQSRDLLPLLCGRSPFSLFLLTREAGESGTDEAFAVAHGLNDDALPGATCLVSVSKTRLFPGPRGESRGERVKVGNTSKKKKTTGGGPECEKRREEGGT